MKNFDWTKCKWFFHKCQTAVFCLAWVWFPPNAGSSEKLSSRISQISFVDHLPESSLVFKNIKRFTSFTRSDQWLMYCNQLYWINCHEMAFVPLEVKYGTCINNWHLKEVFFLKQITFVLYLHSFITLCCRCKMSEQRYKPQSQMRYSKGFANITRFRFLDQNFLQTASISFETSTWFGF